MKRPCIRGLKEFKKGCPEKYWNGSEGCPAWKEYTIPQEDGKPVIIKDCVDMLAEHWAFESLRLLEGNQQAVESCRNVIDKAQTIARANLLMNNSGLGDAPPAIINLMRDKDDSTLLHIKDGW